MQHISQTILKESEEVVNLILLKTYCCFRNLVKSANFKVSLFKLYLISILTI